jgi:hypothetical protein
VDGFDDWKICGTEEDRRLVGQFLTNLPGNFACKNTTPGVNDADPTLVFSTSRITEFRLAV